MRLAFQSSFRQVLRLMTSRKAHPRAVFWLVAATAVWGLSFPLMKVLHFQQHEHADSWFLSAWLLCLRFLGAGLVLLVLAPHTLQGISRRELAQGLGLAAFAAPGMLLQADGLGQTEASTSAFLTQFYCVLLPLWACCAARSLPGRRLTVATVLVVAGVAVLSKIDFHQLRLGPGEMKTLAAAVFFTGQILWLERPQFAGNRAAAVSVVMFLAIGLGGLVMAVSVTRDWPAVASAWGGPAELCILAVITLGCTLFSYWMMNRWQPSVTATEAGLIYALEPVFTAAFTLFLPAWLSAWCGVSYQNERLNTVLLLGGGLITLANIVVQLPGRTRL